jgi:hypothetical protein
MAPWQDNISDKTQITDKHTQANGRIDIHLDPSLLLDSVE